MRLVAFGRCTELLSTNGLLLDSIVPGFTRYFAVMYVAKVAIIIIIPRLFMGPRGNVSPRPGNVSEAGLMLGPSCLLRLPK